MNRIIVHNIQPEIDISCFDLPGSDPIAAPLLLLHGLGADAATTYAHIASSPSLSPSRRILVDLAGFGKSHAPDSWSATIEEHASLIAVLLDRLLLRPGVVVGHSLGGSIAISLATQRPDLVSRLIVAEPNLDPNSGTFSGQITRFTERAFLERGHSMIVRALHLEERRNPGSQPSFAETVAAADPRVLHRTAVSLREPRSFSFRNQLETLSIPKRFIAGEDCIENLTLRNNPYRIDLITIAEAGHVMMHDDPDAFVRAVSGFLR
ncbi:MAG: alpha/beta hydrolase [Thermomicrobiales bacterium]